MKAIKYEKDAVLIQDGNILAWVDIWVEEKDVICDWNQNSFSAIYEGDLVLKKWQDNLNNFELATSLAMSTLEEAGIIYQDEKGYWHQSPKYHTLEGAHPV